MTFYVSQPIADAAFRIVQMAEGNGRFINVYHAAQEIQDAHPRENVALEDIVSTIVDMANGKSLALELSNPAITGGITLEVFVQPE